MVTGVCCGRMDGEGGRGGGIGKEAGAEEGERGGEAVEVRISGTYESQFCPALPYSLTFRGRARAREAEMTRECAWVGARTGLRQLFVARTPSTPRSPKCPLRRGGGLGG